MNINPEIPVEPEPKQHISPILLTRLAYVMTPEHLELFVTACEAARAAGSGFATVEVTFQHNIVNTIRGHFSIKPKNRAEM